MNSLKRQRPGVGDEGRGQKRACSDPVPSHLVRGEHVALILATAPTHTQAQSVLKRCIHKIVTACNLLQATCCACLDARRDNLNAGFSVQGHVFDSDECRWQHYCLGCQAYWDAQTDIGHHHRRPLAVIDVEEIPDTIRVECEHLEVDIFRSVDLTVDRLRAEVARLMWCHPGQLMVSDITLHGGGALPKMSDDNALTLCARHVKFAYITGVESEDDQMQDVQYD